MKQALEQNAGSYTWYKARRHEFETGAKIPFRVSPEPLILSADQAGEIRRIGVVMTQYMQAVNELYQTQEPVHSLLSRNKPPVLLKEKDPKYLFVRPDLIMTHEGFTVCEIETSPFGLALSDLLNKTYRQADFDTLAAENALSDYVKSSTPDRGVIVHSNKTASYAGQMEYLADNIFSGNGRNWVSGHVSQLTSQEGAQIYRGFYQVEYLIDPSVKDVIDSGVIKTPSLTPHMEEKAVLAFAWDKRWSPFLSAQMGKSGLDYIRQIIPPTWIVGEELNFEPGLPNGAESTSGLAGLPRSKRGFVIKPSGFAVNSSWAEGVNLLHEKSAEKAALIIAAAEADDAVLHVVQEFKKAKTVPMQYENSDGSLIPMNARLRVTPYYSMMGRVGELLTIKATGCENTDFIHASSSSINTAVAKA